MKRTAASVAAMLFVACFDEPDYEGRRCFSNEPCPAGYSCGADERCHLGELDAGALDATIAGDASVDPSRCEAPIGYPSTDWEARYYYFSFSDKEFEEQNCFGVEMISGEVLDKDFMFEGPTPEVLTFMSRYTGRRTLAGAYDFSISHDDGGRFFIDDRKIYDGWDGPVRGPIVERHYFPHADYDVRVEHWDSAGEAAVLVRWTPVCMDTSAPLRAWALSYHRVNGGVIDREDCFGFDRVGTSSLGLALAEAPEQVLEGEETDGYAIAGVSRIVHTGTVTFVLSHDDGLRLRDGANVIYEDLAAGPTRTESVDVVFSGEHIVTFEAYDEAGPVNLSITY